MLNMQKESLTQSERYSRTFKFIDKKMHRRNWSVKDHKALYQFPYWLLKKIYSKIDVVTYQGRVTKGRVVYLYIHGEWCKGRIPIIVDVRVELGDPPADAEFMSFIELKQTFLTNKFQG